MVIHISYGVYYETFLPLYHRSLCSRPNSLIKIQTLLQVLLTFTVQIYVSYCSVSSNLDRECPEATDFLTYKMIKNIKLPETFRREYSVSVPYHFFEMDKMKCL